MKPSIASFNGEQIRIGGTWDNPLFVLADVCKVLGLSNPSKVAQTLRDNQKGITTGYTLGGEQQLLTITESGLYQVIFQSRKPIAEAFQDWVTAEVLPVIRKTGRYERPRVKPLPNKVLKQRVIDAKSRLKAYINSLPREGPLTDDMKTFMHIYRAVSQTLWGMDIDAAQSHLGLKDNQHRYAGKWWHYLDDENLLAFAIFLGNTPEWIDSLADTANQVSTHGEYWITSTGFERPTLRRGEIKIPEKPLFLIA
ncbi:BRO family protein [Acaryochloris sp. IP29b_bin.148]|uniref:BRO-N domain-containing protein n=1 Tax=Acaryochloris sp. IP29b_bin.148 TaxID=2969218 RepID=UPI00260240B1|nr:BRO family protein [Acaryochloris sp. IP29b_bin.148]